MQDKHCHVHAEFRNQPWAQVLVGYNVEVTVRIGCLFLLPRQRSRVATTLISIDHTAFSSQKRRRATIG